MIMSGGSFHEHTYNDHSRHKTSIDKYTNLGQNATTIVNQSAKDPDAIEILENYCSHNAAFNAAARLNPPRCAKDTRCRIIKTIETWMDIKGDDNIPTLFWLHGGAGVGKSAVAQYLSEAYKDNLVGSFFFARSELSRNNGENVIPTLALHLIHAWKEIRPFVEQSIHENQVIFKLNCETQMHQLLVKPLLAFLEDSQNINVKRPHFIVIDGLDECQNLFFQDELLRVIARAIPRIPYPLRFLVTSRSETHITELFDHDQDLQAIKQRIKRYNLSDDPEASMDIRKYLHDEFREICKRRPHLPHGWPDPDNITSLVNRASGHFIYAWTVMKYVKSRKHRPEERLEIVLRFRPPEGDRPYEQLDEVYNVIFRSVETDCLKKICLILGVHYFQSKNIGISKLPTITIEKLFGMKPGELDSLLVPVRSLVTIYGPNIRVLHESLIDYLLDAKRAEFPLDLSQVHSFAATYILNHWIRKNLCDVNQFQCFVFHCQYAHPDDTLIGYLRSVEVPWPKSVKIIHKAIPSWDDDLSYSLRSIIWHICRTLSREDFDSTGKFYKKYMARWIAHLHPSFPRRQIKAMVAKWDLLIQRQKARDDHTKIDMKNELDDLLKNWRPKEINSVGETKSPVPESRIKQEHRVFSVYTKLSFTGNTVISSLVASQDFVHCYNLGIREQSNNAHALEFLFLRIYARHTHACFHLMKTGDLSDVVQETKDCLELAEIYLSSNLYQN